MTVINKLESFLTDRGMSPSQASEVMALCVPELNKLDDAYRITYDSPSDHYPEIMYMLWWSVIQPIALKWIDDNKPQAWFRGMFN